LGCIGSGLWDIVAKPGAGWLVALVLWIASTLSTTLKDAPYSTAALDPSSLPPLIIFYLATILLPIWMVFEEYRRRTGRRLPPRVRRLLSYPPPSDASPEPSRRGRLTWAYNLLAAIVLLSACGLTLTAATVNRAIAIRRIFQANIAICTPRFTSDVRNSLTAQFSAMQTRADYEILVTRLEQVAESSGCKLRPERL